MAIESTRLIQVSAHVALGRAIINSPMQNAATPQLDLDPVVAAADIVSRQAERA